MNGHIPCWVQDSLRTEPVQPHSRDIVYRPLIASLSARVSAVCIITTNWYLSRRELLRSTGLKACLYFAVAVDSAARFSSTRAPARMFARP